MSKHRNPLKYIERFYLNTYFNLNLPGGKKAVCYRPVKTNVNLGLDKPREPETVTLEDINALIGGSELKKKSKEEGTFSYLESHTVWRKDKTSFQLIGRPTNSTDLNVS